MQLHHSWGLSQGSDLCPQLAFLDDPVPSLDSQLQARPELQLGPPRGKVAVPSSQSLSTTVSMCSARPFISPTLNLCLFLLASPISANSTTLHPARFQTQALRTPRKQCMAAKSMHTSETLGLAEQAAMRGRREREQLSASQTPPALLAGMVFFLGVNTSPGSFFSLPMAVIA